MTERFTERVLHSQPAGRGHVLCAIHDRDPGQRGFRIFFRKGLPVEAISTSPRIAVERSGSIGGAPLLYGRVHGTPDSVTVHIDGAPCDIRLFPDERHLFAGLRTGVVIRNGEPPRIAADWIDWHMRHFGMEAVLIVDRSPPGDHQDFARALIPLIHPLTDLQRAVLVTSPLPLGADHLPDEAHPFNVPGAPGKDRMDLPDADPWRAPMDSGNIWELLRARFLDDAAAVLNIDLHDLIPPDAPNPFDRAAQDGAVILHGRQVYPWRVRDEDDAHFADHICVPFDGSQIATRWAVCPERTGPHTVWRPVRIVGAAPDPTRAIGYDRYMAVRHHFEAIGRIVPKSSLIEDAALLRLSQTQWHHKPVRMPKVEMTRPPDGPIRTVIVTCMKNEGPFILEWLAWHRAIGVTDFLVYTNDCDDGTDSFLELLQQKGLVQHRDNPFRDTGQKPQHAALAAADREDCVQNADWAISMDVDEFINIKIGDGTLKTLFDAVPDANLISCTWRLFGNSDIHGYTPGESLIRDYTRCAREFANKPHQAWGFKTLFRQLGIFKKMGVHRPKGLNSQLWHAIHWVNGSGKPLPRDMYRNAWRSTSSTYGYDIVQLNHYAVRSAESFLVKRDRGRVNHVDRDQGLAYWFRMNNNGEEDLSLRRRHDMMEKERQRLLSDPDIRAAHEACIRAHQAKIAALKQRPDQQKFFTTLTSDRMQRLSRLHGHFGANVFLGGPDTVPDDVAFGDHPPDFFFTVNSVDETQH